MPFVGQFTAPRPKTQLTRLQRAQVKEQKNSAYFSRYQVKYRRRRGKFASLATHLLALTIVGSQRARPTTTRVSVSSSRRRTSTPARRCAVQSLTDSSRNSRLLPAQYRLVVRITNKDVICQIVSAKLQGDVVLAAAYSHELPRYGIKHGLTNWAACYATGLLCARRALTKLGLADKYEGVTEPSGELELTEPIEGEPRPFKCFLDVGVARTSTGARVFGAMKGASDGGVFIPHSEQRFPGFDPESKELDAETLCVRLAP